MKSSVGGAAANVVMTHAFPEMEPGMLRFSGKLIIASLLALAQPIASHGQTTFPTANGSSVPGAVMMCVDSATGLAAPVLVSGSTCPGSGGGTAGNITQWASVALGAPSQFGTTPGAVNVPGVNASVISSALPTGAATAANQATIITSLSTLNTNVTSPLPTQDPTVDVGAFGISQTTVGTTNAVSLKYLNTTAVDTNSGNKSAGTQRNVLATDQFALAAWGQGANGATAPTSSTQEGCRSASTAPTEVTDGQMTPIQCGLGGKQIVMPFTVKELAVRGKATSTDTSPHDIIASAGGSLKNYITGVQCYNTSATSVVITFNDSITTPLLLPSTGGNNATYLVPLVTAAATAFQFTSPSGLTTIGCAAQGFIGL